MKVFNYSVRVLNGKKNPTEETGDQKVPLKHGEKYSLLLRNFSDKDALAKIKIDGKEVGCVKVPANGKTEVDGPFDSDQQFTFYKKTSEEAAELELDLIDRDDLGSIEVKFVEVPNGARWQEKVVGSTIIYVPYYEYWYPWWRPTLTTTLWNGPVWTTAHTVNLEGASTSYTVANMNVSSSISGTSSGGGSGTTGYKLRNQDVTLTSSYNAGLSSGGTGLSGMAEHTPSETEELKKDFLKHLDEEIATTIYLLLVCKDSSYKAIPNRMVGHSNQKPIPID